MTAYSLNYYNKFKKSTANAVEYDDIALKSDSTMMVFNNPKYIDNYGDLKPITSFTRVNFNQTGSDNTSEYVAIFNTLAVSLDVRDDPRYDKKFVYMLVSKGIDKTVNSKMIQSVNTNFDGLLTGYKVVGEHLIHADADNFPMLYSKLKKFKSAIIPIDPNRERYTNFNDTTSYITKHITNGYDTINFQLPLLATIAKITPNRLDEIATSRDSYLNNLSMVFATPGFYFEEFVIKPTRDGKDRLNIKLRTDNKFVLYKTNLSGDVTKLDDTYVFTYRKAVTLQDIYNDIILTVSKDQSFLCEHLPKYRHSPSLAVAIVDQYSEDRLVITSDKIKIVTEGDGIISSTPNMREINYRYAYELNLADDVNMIVNDGQFSGDVFRITSPVAMNVYAEVYSDDNFEKQPVKVFFKENINSFDVAVGKTGRIKVAAWSLGKASYYTLLTPDEYGRPETHTHPITWVDYEHNVLNLNALRSATALMSQSNINFTAHGVELALPEAKISADEAKMMLHLFSGSRLGLAATAKGGDQLISKIDFDKFSVFAPIFTVVKKPELTAEQKVEVDFFIDDSIAIRLNPAYIPNPSKPNGSVTLRNRPYEGEKELVRKQIELKSLAQETVEALMKHSQFLSATTIAMALDK